MRQLKTIDDFYRLGFNSLIHRETGRQEIWQFIGEQLRRAQHDPEASFSFGGHLTAYLRGEADGPPELRADLRREATRFFSGIRGDLKHVLISTRNEDTALSALKSLVLNLPLVAGQAVDPAAEALPMIDLWLIMFRLLRQWQERPANLMRLTVRSFYRWRSGPLAEAAAAGSDFESFARSLDEASRTPLPEVLALRTLLSEQSHDDPRAALVLRLQADPMDRYAAPDLWQQIEAGGAARARLLGERAAGLPGDFLPPSEVEALLAILQREV